MAIKSQGARWVIDDIANDYKKYTQEKYAYRFLEICKDYFGNRNG